MHVARMPRLRQKQQRRDGGGAKRREEEGRGERRREEEGRGRRRREEEEGGERERARTVHPLVTTSRSPDSHLPSILFPVWPRWGYPWQKVDPVVFLLFHLKASQL